MNVTAGALTLRAVAAGVLWRMNRDVLEKILNCPELPSLPEVAVRVIELTRRTDASFEELAQVIQNDQGLAAKILRTVNSSFYGLRRPCATINQAILMLGFSAVRSLALGFSLVTSFASGGDDRFDYIAYWRRGLYTAAAAKRIAAEAGRCDEDEAFLGGLLQDVGMMAMYQTLGECYLRVLARAGNDHRRLVRFELIELEAQHPEVGALLAARWKLPDSLVIPVKYHERPTAAPSEHAELARCVGLANIAHDVLTLAAPDDAVRRFHALARSWFGIDAGRCELLLGQIAEDAKQVSDLFRLDTGPQADAAQILRDAEERLAALDSAPPPGDDGASLGGLLLDAEDTDPLTGVLNRAAFLRKADAVMLSARGPERRVAMLGLSIDGFCCFAPTHGTETTDAVLAETARLLVERLEPYGGFVCRWDRCLFAACLPETDAAAAVRLAGAVRAMVEAGSKHWRVTPNSPPVPVTASLGVAVAEGDMAPLFTRAPHLIAAAARASEAAAAAGGNCVRSFIPRTKAA